MTRRHRYILGAFVLLVIFTSIILFSGVFADVDLIQVLVDEFGYLGVVMAGVVGGLNTVIPVPPATLTPLFVSAGLSFPLIVLMLTIGILIADYIGYALGHVSREMMKLKHPRIFSFFLKLKDEHLVLVAPSVFLFAALLPIPNELIVIPLALSGVRFYHLILPLLFGNLVSQTVLAYGFTSLFDVLF